MNEFEFRPDRTTDYGVSCPWASKKYPYRPYNGENGVSTFSLLFLIGSFWYFHVTRTSIKAWMSLNFLKWDLILAHWTQVSDRCPLGCLLKLANEWRDKTFLLKLKLCLLGLSAPAPGLYTCIKARKIMYKIRLQRDFFGTCNKWPKWQHVPVDIKISSPRGCQPLPLPAPVSPSPCSDWKYSISGSSARNTCSISRICTMSS